MVLSVSSYSRYLLRLKCNMKFSMMISTGDSVRSIIKTMSIS